MPKSSTEALPLCCSAWALARARTVTTGPRASSNRTRRDTDTVTSPYCRWTVTAAAAPSRARSATTLVASPRAAARAPARAASTHCTWAIVA